MARATVFLDRDGTINVDSGYQCDPNSLELIPGAAKALGLLRLNGYRLVVVSNQSAIGRGFATVEQVEATNRRLCELLLAEDPLAQIDLILYCPHRPDQNCSCRKPLGGMIEHESGCRAADWVIGDKLSDLEFGTNVGISARRQILLLTGEGPAQLARAKEQTSAPDFVVCENLLAAAKYVTEIG